MGCCRPSVPRRFSPGQRGFLLCSLLRGRGRAAPPSPPESGSRGPAEHEPGRERGGDARPPPPGPGVSDPRRRQLRIPGLLASSPQRQERPQLASGRTQKGYGAKAVACGEPRAGWKIADKGILETVELRNAGSSLGLRGAIPGVASLSARGSSAPGLWERLLRFCFGFNLNTENPPFASAARILQRRLPVRWRCGACRLGWGPRTPGACYLGAAVEPAPCETVAPDTHPTSARRGPRSVAAPGPRNPRRTRPQMPSQGWWSEPCMPPGMRSVRKPLCADLAWPPPPPSAAQENFF